MGHVVSKASGSGDSWIESASHVDSRSVALIELASLEVLLLLCFFVRVFLTILVLLLLTKALQGL